MTTDTPFAWEAEHGDALLALARGAYDRAWAPYSRFHVGAAVLTRSGGRYSGCNVENATYGATVCAERHAVAAAVMGGDHDIVAVVVYVGIDLPALPCGICRQVLAEFGDDIDVLSVSASGRRERSTIDALLPGRFRGEDIDRPRVTPASEEG